MDKLFTKKQYERIRKEGFNTEFTADGDGLVLNQGLEVDSNGDVTVGKDLIVEDEIVIDNLTKIVDTDGVALFWSGTQAQYDAIVTKNANTLYLIVG